MADSEMGRLVRLAHGIWEKNGGGEWSFINVEDGPVLSILVQENATYEKLVETMKKQFYVDVDTMMALTYQYPAWMLQPAGNITPPVDFNEDGDVELFMAVHVDHPEMAICVTIGSYHVERYIFQRSSGYDFGRSSQQVGGLTMGVMSKTDVAPRLLTVPKDIRQSTSRANLNVAGGLQNVLMTCGDVDDAMAFWEGIAGDGVLMASEKVLQEVCSPDELGIMDMCHAALLSGPPIPTVVVSDDDGSSTGSSDDVASVVMGDGVAGLEQMIQVSGGGDQRLIPSSTNGKGKGIMVDDEAQSKRPTGVVVRRAAVTGAPLDDLSPEMSSEGNHLSS